LRWNCRGITLHITFASRSRNCAAKLAHDDSNVFDFQLSYKYWAGTIFDGRRLLEGRKHIFWVSDVMISRHAKHRFDLCVFGIAFNTAALLKNVLCDDEWGRDPPACYFKSKRITQILF
jgi:hypothetical protein